MSWQQIAEKKRQQVFSSIPKEWVLDAIPSPESVPNACEYVNGLISDKEREITNGTVSSLSKAIAEGKYTSVEVTRAFCHRTALIQQLTNCCSEIFFERGLSRAAELDRILKTTGKVVGPLHGVPISLKDQFNLEGIDSSLGYASLVGHPKEKSDVSDLARLLEQMGAVFFVKTTTSMAMISIDTVSNVYGYTLNSLNRKVSPGGSSGGEGALVGARGAPAGFGTDIGGSIRIPSLFQGLYGLRPTSHRLPYQNISNAMAHQPLLASVVGPMCHDLDDMRLLTKLIIESEPWLYDSKTPPVRWDDTPIGPSEKLTFAFIGENTGELIHPPVKRALDTVKKALILKGHLVFEWSPPFTPQQLGALAEKIYVSDALKEVFDECAKTGEPPLEDLAKLPEILLHADSASAIHEHWRLGEDRYRFQKLYDQYWLSTSTLTGTRRPVDALIAPIGCLASYKLGDSRIFAEHYATMFNILDYPVVATPVAVCSQENDPKDASYNPPNEWEREVHDYYDPVLFEGTTVGVQVVGRRYHEERTIRLAETVSAALKNTP